MGHPTVPWGRLGEGTHPADQCVGGVKLSGRPNWHQQVAWCGTKHYSDNLAPSKSAWRETAGSDCIPDVVLCDSDVTGDCGYSIGLWGQSVTMSTWGVG